MSCRDVGLEMGFLPEYLTAGLAAVEAASGEVVGCDIADFCCCMHWG